MYSFYRCSSIINFWPLFRKIYFYRFFALWGLCFIYKRPRLLCFFFALSNAEDVCVCDDVIFSWWADTFVRDDVTAFWRADTFLNDDVTLLLFDVTFLQQDETSCCSVFSVRFPCTFFVWIKKMAVLKLSLLHHTNLRRPFNVLFYQILSSLFRFALPVFVVLYYLLLPGFGLFLLWLQVALSEYLFLPPAFEVFPPRPLLFLRALSFFQLETSHPSAGLTLASVSPRLKQHEWFPQTPLWLQHR